MSEAVNSRKARQSYLRETQQEAARRKKELALQQREDMKALKAYYADEVGKVEDDNTAAVNHIKEEDKTERQMAHDEKLEMKATYDRSGKTKAQAMASQKPSVQNYITKDTDNFYKVQDRGSRVSESSKGYFIDAYAPDHEKDQIRVSIQNDKAVISGKRKFQDSVDQGNKKISTNNFQSFREEFSFDRPVAAEGITRERSGDYIRFFIPKMETASFDKDKKS